MTPPCLQAQTHLLFLRLVGPGAAASRHDCQLSDYSKLESPVLVCKTLAAHRITV